MIVRLALIAAGVAVFRAPWGTLPIMAACLVVLFAFEIYVVVDAGRGLPAGGATPEPDENTLTGDESFGEPVARQRKDPWLAMFLSRLVPGLGHVYAGRWAMGLGLFLAFLVIAGLSPQIFSNPLDVLISTGAGLLAFRAVRPGFEESRPAFRMAAYAIIGFAVVATLIASIRGGLVQAFRNASASMQPTMVPGDLFFVDKAWGQPIERGDIVAFDWPRDRRMQFVKRVVAVPGDTVEVRHKAVLIDGEPLAEPYVRHVDPALHPAADDPRDEFGPLVMSDGQYFLLGDNRDDSNDSRFWGPVSRRDIRGRVIKRYWPPDRAGPVR